MHAKLFIIIFAPGMGAYFASFHRSHCFIVRIVRGFDDIHVFPQWRFLKLRAGRREIRQYCKHWQPEAPARAGLIPDEEPPSLALRAAKPPLEVRRTNA
jgi:hypothetical protein